MIQLRAGVESEQKDEQSSTGHSQDDEKERECWSVKRESRVDTQEEAEISLKSDHNFPQEKKCWEIFLSGRFPFPALAGPSHSEASLPGLTHQCSLQVTFISLFLFLATKSIKGFIRILLIHFNIPK